MKIRLIYMILFMGVLMLFAPVKTQALTIENYNNNVYKNVLKEKPINSTKDVKDLTADYNQNQNCNTLLGNPSDENSVAWLVQKVLNYIQILGPLLVVILSSLDFAHVIIKSDDEAMAKAQKKLWIRLALAVCLFFIPILVRVLLHTFGITSDPTCGLQ